MGSSSTFVSIARGCDLPLSHLSPRSPSTRQDVRADAVDVCQCRSWAPDWHGRHEWDGAKGHRASLADAIELGPHGSAGGGAAMPERLLRHGPQVQRRASGVLRGAARCDASVLLLLLLLQAEGMSRA